MNYEELVKALRWCDASFLHECGNCLYVKYKHCKDDCMDRMLRDAAAAIEALNRLLDQNTQRCEALRKQLREAHESYERHLNELEAQLPKRGEWKRDEKRWGENSIRCSLCGAVIEDEEWGWRNWNYCYHCGAKMEPPKEEE